ncbi:MAG: phosphatase PAP2 family protein, partial [Bacteroidales bacterium]|nr:phosphatase PAP2 family protein [Bacteroidales bacterium]
INNWASPLMDNVMMFMSKVTVWIPLYCLVAAALFFKGSYGPTSIVRKNKIKKLWPVAIVAIACIALSYVFADHIASFVKDSVCRLRPSHEPAIADSVRLVTGQGSLYGFYSGHATNTFGFAMITSLIFRRKLYGWCIFGWAAVVSYSRIYLAFHYPGDILAGAIAGVLISLVMYAVYNWILKKYFLNRA